MPPKRRLFLILCVFLAHVGFALPGCNRNYTPVLQRFTSEEVEKKRGVLPLRGLNGSHVVGMICEEEYWKFLKSREGEIVAKVVGPIKEGSSVAVSGGYRGTSAETIPGFRYLFTVSGPGVVDVELSLPKRPDSSVKDRYEIVVAKSVYQTVW